MKKSIILLGAISAITLTSCGVTTARISKPEQGTQTTITITTNNPISTNVDPNVILDGGKSK